MAISYHTQHAVFSSDYQKEGVFFLNYKKARKKKGRWGGTALILSLDHDRGACQLFVQVSAHEDLSHAYNLLEDRLAFSVFGLIQRMKNGLEVLSVAIREWRES